MKKKELKNLFFAFFLASPLLLSGCNTHTHTFNLEEPIWTWSQDKSSASLKFKCSSCGAETEEMVDEDIVVVPGVPTCLQGATTTYTAEIIYNDQTFTDVKSINLDPLGHEFTSISVSGIKSSYDALEEIENIVVTKNCVRGDSVIANNSEVEIEYETDDDFLHYGDEHVTIKIKNTSLSATVDVNVKKIVVTRPMPDESSFVYNQNEQEYQIAQSEYYHVEGNKKTDAGTTNVIVKLANGLYNDLVWDDGTDDDLSFPFIIDKATPVISGIENSYTLSCGDNLDVSNITSSIGTLSFILKDGEDNDVELNSIKGGEYTLIAKVSGNNNLNEVIATAKVVSNHEENWPPVIASSDNARIGNKQGSCNKCNEALFKPVEYGDLNASWGFGFGINGPTMATSSLVGEFPEYATSSRNAYRGWAINNDVTQASMPRVDFNVFDHVSFVIHTNARTASKYYTGIGYNENDDIVSFGEHGDAVKYVVDSIYDKNTGKIDITIRSNYGFENSFAINDESVINGDSSIVLKLHGGAWRQFIFDDILFDHACEEYIDVEKLIYPGIEKVCKGCFRHKDIGDREIIYTAIDDFGKNNEFGFASDNSAITIGVDSSEDVGSLKIGGNQGNQVVSNIILPVINYKAVTNVKFVFSCNAGGSLIGSDSENTVATISNTKTQNKSSITVKFDEDSDALNVSIRIDDEHTLNYKVTDCNVVLGLTGLNLHTSLKPWHYLAFSKLIINYIEE